MYCTAICKCKFPNIPGTWFTYLTSILKHGVAVDHARCLTRCATPLIGGLQQVMWPFIPLWGTVLKFRQRFAQANIF
jgi:hypothetical protein